jgi:thioredoxin 1
MAGPVDTFRVMSNKLLEVDDRNFETTVLQSPVPVLLDFTAVWCPPCRAIAPHVEAVAERHAGRIRVGSVDSDSNPELSARYDVRALPTLLLFSGGQVVGQIVGAVPRARIEALVERVLGAPSQREAGVERHA